MTKSMANSGQRSKVWSKFAKLLSKHLFQGWLPHLDATHLYYGRSKENNGIRDARSVADLE